MGSTFGVVFRVSTFGESHGPATGCVIDGCPAGLEWDLTYIQQELNRRKPGQSAIVSQRKESDTVKVLSGVFDGKTTGAPIALVIENEDARTKDYDHLVEVYRPSHADFTWDAKFGLRDHRGGGRSSARETAVRVAAGAVAKLLLKKVGVSIAAYVSQVGPIILEKDYSQLDLQKIDDFMVRCPDAETAEQMEALIRETRKAGDTVGGTITGVIKGCPAGLGSPVFDKLHADLGKAMLSINAAKGFEYGSGFSGASWFGSQHNDPFIQNAEGRIVTKTNYSGGIQGGISNGMDIYFKVAFKPVATLLRDQPSVDRQGNPIIVQGKGRHDPCVLPRAAPIVESMAALVIADHWLRTRTDRL